MSNFLSNEPCVVCGLNVHGMVTYHHLYTQKAHPELKREKWNLISCCGSHHTPLFHTKPLSEVANKYPQVRQWLIDNEWDLIDSPKGPIWFHKKWFTS
jgi:hypothetical protein